MAGPTSPQWEYDLLKALGAPASKNNLTALNLWAQSEGSVTNNPLATSGQGVGATKCVAQCGSTSPIFEYDTEADGVAQMSSFLKGSYYTAIVRAFVQDAGLAAIYQAINSSPWCKDKTGRPCQNGLYPEDLAAAVGGKAEATSPTVGTGASSTGQSGSGSGSSLSTCVIELPGFLFFSGPCFLTKGGVKWLSGAVCIAAGTAVAGFGVILLASAVGQSTGATAAVKKGARTAGIGASLLAGEPEVALGIAQTTKGAGATGTKVPNFPADSEQQSQARAARGERAAQLKQSDRTARDISALYRPNNRGLSRESTTKNRGRASDLDWARQKGEADAKARAANF
jgi:hypothetical protein